MEMTRLITVIDVIRVIFGKLIQYICSTEVKEKKIIIKKPALFSFEECLWFLDRNLDDCMHCVEDDKVRKALRIGKKNVLFEVSEENENLTIKILKGTPDSVHAIIEYVNEWFDLDRDLRPFYRLLSRDRELSILGKDYRGMRIMGIPDFFEVLC